MVPVILAIAGPVLGLIVAGLGIIAGLGPNRAKSANDYATAASSFAAAAGETNRRLEALTTEVHGIKVVVEEMVDVVRVDVLPLIEGNHPEVAAKLRLVKSKVEAAI